MNLPNKLTVLRVIMVPFFVFFMLTDVGGAANKWIALAIFVIASLTDMLDGKIARKYNLVTNFGKFMDPLADKLLVCSAMICLIPSGKLPTAIVIVIIAREFISLFCNDRISWNAPFIIYRSDHYYCKRIYHQWIPAGCIRQRNCDRSKLLGKI